LDSSGKVDLSEIEPQIYLPKQTPVKSNGNDVHFEAEVGQMIKNTLRHKAYIRLLGKKYKQIELAMNVK
jgi:flagellar basal body rod protein FlgB